MIFPTAQTKVPAIPKGTSWKKWEGDEEEITLAGLDLSKADMVVADFDTYKPEFKASREAKAFFEEVRKRCMFCQQTQSGGTHYFFRQPEGRKIKNSAPFPGVEIKAGGGYVCLYEEVQISHELSTFKQFHSCLPVFDFTDFKQNTRVAKSTPPKKLKKAGVSPTLTPRKEIGAISATLIAHKDAQRLSTIKKQEINGVDVTPPVPTGSKIPQKTPTEPGPGSNNKSIAQNMFRIAKSGNVDEAVEYFKLFFKNNEGRGAAFNLDAHLRDALNILFNNIKSTGKGKVEAEEENPDIYKITPFSSIQKKKPTGFYENFLLKNEFNFIYGANKLGKTQGMLFILNKALEGDDKCGILSTENDPEMMLGRLLQFMKWEDKFVHLNDALIKSFTMKGAKTGPDKIKVFLDRIRKLLTDNKLKVLLLDPLPRFFDWNAESPACMMLDGLRELSKQFSTTIIGIRNEGKNQSYESSAMYKGSSVIGDLSRQVIRAIKVHPKSAIGKERIKDADGKEVPAHEGKKCLILYTELSSLFKQQAFLFRLEVDKTQNLSYPILIREIDADMETVRYLADKRSGQSLGIKIALFVKEQGTVTLDDLCEEFEGQYERETIRRTADRHCDSVKEGGKIRVYIPFAPPPHPK